MTMPVTVGSARPSRAPVLLQAAVIALLLVVGITRAVTFDPSVGDTLTVADLRAASASARDASTARGEMTFTFRSDGTTLSMAADGVFDFGRKRSSFTFDLDQFGAGAGLGTMEMVVDGTTLYMRSAALTQRMPGLKQWVSVTVPEGSAPAAGDPFADPASYLTYLESVSGSVERIGGERVRGVATTHYAAVTSVESMLDQLSGEAREAARRALAAAGVTEIPTDIWIDADGLPRRIETRVGMAKKTSVTFRLEMFDFGTGVSIDVPAPSEATPMPSMADLQRSLVPGAPAS